MNILFLTLIDFSTIEERNIYSDLLREFTKEDHNLYIISPTESRKKEPTRLLESGKSKILKLRIGNFQKTNYFVKGITTMTLETIFKYAIKKYFNSVKFDLVLYSTPPITLQKAVEYVKRRDNALTYLLLKDIFPQNAVDIGVINKKGIKGLFYYYFKFKEQKLYNSSDYIGCMSEANVDYIIKNNPEVKSSKIEVCPNSIEPIIYSFTEHEKNELRDKFNLPKDKSVFIYGGNLGKPQGIDFLIKCLRANEENSESFFLIVGSGTEYKKLHKYFDSEKPHNSKLINQLPNEDYDMLLFSCDVGMIFLDYRFTIPNFPSRLLTYMQASMPILAATDSNTDIKDIIEKGNLGYWCESTSVEKFNKLVIDLCDSNIRKNMGMNSREYLAEHYTARHSYEIIEKHFKN